MNSNGGNNTGVGGVPPPTPIQVKKPKEETLQDLMTEVKSSIDDRDLKILELSERNEYLESEFIKVKDMLRGMVGKRSD